MLSPGTVAARSAGRRYRLVANNWTERLALNTARPAFSDEAVRRAVAYALDRRRLARALAGGDFQLPDQRLAPAEPPRLRTARRIR